MKPMQFCSQCGVHDIKQIIPGGDTHLRYVCSNCDAVFYENPNIVAATVLEWENKILFCRRAIEPKSGFWTLPGGFMENGESVTEAAARESWEEAHAECGHLQLHSVFSLKYVNQVYMVYRGGLKNGIAKPGTESLEVKLYEEKNIPWDLIAFPVIFESLKLFLKDRKRGQYGVHHSEFDLIDNDLKLKLISNSY